MLATSDWVASEGWMAGLFDQASEFSANNRHGVLDVDHPVPVLSFLAPLLRHGALLDRDVYRQSFLDAREWLSRHAFESPPDQVMFFKNTGAFLATVRAGADPSPTIRTRPVVVREPEGGQYIPPAIRCITPGLNTLVRLSRARCRSGSLDSCTVLAIYIILMQIHPFEDGNGRCARHLVHVLSRHDPRLACTRLIGLLGLHRARGRLFVPCVKAARAGDFDPMLHVYSQQMETGIREWTPLFDGMSGSTQDDAQWQVVANAVCQRARFLLEQG